ncbi:MAG: glycogen/starch/alpha-glucan phosphorylase [Burkholderiales bacterium]|nr:glycogen/starch/alpha-glucan phosphorylase [Burkholderiales bacterium]
MKNPAALPELNHPTLDAESIRRSLYQHLVFTVGKDPITATDRDWFYAAAAVVRERMIERWMATMRSYYQDDRKRVYYLSLEFLMGRAMANSMHNICAEKEFHDALAALKELGLKPESLQEVEPDAGLGNGGLGRLAACFLDSMATMGIPGYGYGIRYEYGMFHQGIENGQQIEHPDNWLRYGNPWEFPRPEVLYQVKFHGRVVDYADEQGTQRYQWVDTDDVMAMAYDYPIPGFDTGTVNNMRLWAAKASRDFDLTYFNEGDYIRAVEDKNESENLSKVLYPNDTTEGGRELRLKQQYFFVCASIQDMLYRFAKSGLPLDELPNRVAVQLNDTHPSIAVAELMRILCDLHKMEWTRAWGLTTRTFAYTNHTLMPEALETWPVALFERVLPRHLQIIFDINHRFMKDVMRHYPGDPALWARMSLIDESHGRRIRMAHLAIVGSHKVNGVAAIHTRLMKETIFADFHRLWPDKIVNMTNGVTPRRWLNQANPGLAHLITSRIGKGWIKNLDQLRQLTPLASDPEFQAAFVQVKRDNKARLASLIHERLSIRVNPDSLFDVQIKRIHEYKRQLLNVLHVITLYSRIRAGGCDAPARTVIFGGKAAPGYRMAKLIIRLINDVADIVNNDSAVGDRLKVVFIPNYNVSTAEIIIPAADLSEQISTAGTEASGTGNMKLALNGALTIGTLDGANVEMRDEVGAENFFIFGLTADEVTQTYRSSYNPWDYYNNNAELKQTLDMLRDGYFSPEDRDRYKAIFEVLTHHGDHYRLLADYSAYVACQDQVGQLYRDPAAWTQKAILNVAGMGQFSSDRTIAQYAQTIWHTEPKARSAT